MKQKTKAPLKVGVIDFINSYPLFYPLRFGKIPTDVQFLVDTPEKVNQLLEKGEVDIGLISSSSYVDNRSEYILLSDLGIGAKEKVVSVCVFCRQNAFDCTKATSFLIPSHSMTSSRLLKVLSHRYWKSNATFYETQLSEDELFAQNLPFLLIGDSSLRRRFHNKITIIDLASAWNKETGLSFVFSLVATRNDTFLKKQEDVLRFHKNLIQAYAWSKENENELIQVCSKKLHISPHFTKEYFRTLDYELAQDHINGLDHFSTFRL